MLFLVVMLGIDTSMILDMGKVAVVGSANLDFVFRCPELPRPGETLLGGSFSTHPGGKGANQATAIAALKGSVQFVGCVGDDPEGEFLVTTLSEAGVGIERLQVIQGRRTGTACVLVSDSSSNMIVVAPGANNEVSSAQVTSAHGHIKPDIVLCQLEIPIASVTAAAQVDRFILNPAPAQPLSSELLARCFVLTPNESELESLTGIRPDTLEDCEKAAKPLLEAGVQNVIITLGSRGCSWASESGVTHFPSRKVDAIDTTAAGDAFNGALAHFLAEGRTILEAIPLANAVAAISTTKVGAQESMPSMGELQAFAPDLF
ncbi:MAG: ribokinase [Chthonomonas sp.]|nr:ribokinase [Chthonomonas sp.]